MDLHWTLANPPRYTIIPGVIAGVVVHVYSGASENARAAARGLADALDDNNIAAIEKDNTTTDSPSDTLYLQVGIKP